MVKEQDLQISVSKYLKDIERLFKTIFYFHVPNSIFTSKAQAGKHKAYGMTAGVPDCVIALDNGRTIYIELKTIKGKMQDTQKRVKTKLEVLGHPVYVVYADSCKSAVDQVEKILKSEGVEC